MSSPTHTPGPWIVNGGETYRYEVFARAGPRFVTIARVGVPQFPGSTVDERHEQSRANGALIAAAPLLAAALETLLSECPPPHPQYLDSPGVLAVEAARTALRAAGRTP